MKIVVCYFHNDVIICPLCEKVNNLFHRKPIHVFIFHFVHNLTICFSFSFALVFGADLCYILITKRKGDTDEQVTVPATQAKLSGGENALQTYDPGE